MSNTDARTHSEWQQLQATMLRHQTQMTDDDGRLIKSEFEARGNFLVYEFENFVGRIRGEAEVAVSQLCDELMETQSYLASCESEISHKFHMLR